MLGCMQTTLIARLSRAAYLFFHIPSAFFTTEQCFDLMCIAVTEPDAMCIAVTEPNAMCIDATEPIAMS